MMYPKYDYEELRKISEDAEEDSNEEPDNPNYKCVVCDKKTRIDGEHKVHVKYWCRNCDEIQTHQKL